MVVISVSMSSEELAEFDNLVEHFNYDSRSGAIRDALYTFIAQHRIEFQDQATLILTLVYPTERGQEKVHQVVHENEDLVDLTLHRHFGERCVDLVVLSGQGDRVHEVLDELSTLKEVRVTVSHV